jgi:hypothetical protein
VPEDLPISRATGEGARAPDEKESSTALLVVSILLMVVVLCLFGYLIYREKEKRDQVAEQAKKGEKKQNS